MLRAFPSVFFNANQHLETDIWEFLSVGSKQLEKLVSKCKSVTYVPLSLLPLVRRLVVTTEE